MTGYESVQSNPRYAGVYKNLAGAVDKLSSTVTSRPGHSPETVLSIASLLVVYTPYRSAA